MPQMSHVIDFLLRLYARRPRLNAPAVSANNGSALVNPRRPNFAIRLFVIFGRISRSWGPVGCWTALTYFIVRTGHGANLIRGLSNRLAESTFLVRILSYLFRWFGRDTGPVDHVADSLEHVATFFRHASAAFKSAKDVLNKISENSTSVSHENNSTTNSNEDPGDGTAAVSTEVDSPRADNDDVEPTFPGDQEINRPGKAEVEVRIISSIEEGKQFLSKWKEEGGGFSFDVPLDMPTQVVIELLRWFRCMGVMSLIDGPNVKAILEKKLASAQSDLKAATENVANLKSLMRPFACKTDI